MSKGGGLSSNRADVLLNIHASDGRPLCTSLWEWIGRGGFCPTLYFATISCRKAMCWDSTWRRSWVERENIGQESAGWHPGWNPPPSPLFRPPPPPPFRSQSGAICAWGVGRHVSPHKPHP